MLLLIAVWIFFMRQMQGGKGGAMGFGRSKAKMMNEMKGKVTFNDVAGVEEAKEEVEEIVEFLKAYKPEVNEAEYQGRKVKLGKPMQGDVKKFKVYVKNPKGNVVKVNFGQKGVKIKKNNPARRKSFRARHNCSNPGPRHKARYWSCRKW